MTQYTKFMLKVSSIVVYLIMNVSLSSSLAHWTQPNIVIHPIDNRMYSKTMRIEARFKVNGKWHYDWEVIKIGKQRFACIGKAPFPELVLDGRGGKKNSAGTYVGNFLKQTGYRSDKLKIQNFDFGRDRKITDLSITTTITINGKVHWDYEDIGNFYFGIGDPMFTHCDLECNLNFKGGRWDKKSKMFRGNFLKIARRDCSDPYY